MSSDSERPRFELIFKTYSSKAHDVPLVQCVCEVSFWELQFVHLFALSCKKTYRKIPNTSPGLIDLRKHLLGAYIRGAYNRGLIFVGHFVLVSEYQYFKIIYCYISLL